MKKIIIISLLLSIHHVLQSQDSLSITRPFKKAIYGELGGAAGPGTTINFEFVVFRKDIYSIVGRLGAGIYVSEIDLLGEGISTSVILPATLSLVAGQTHGFEIGAGASFGTDNAEDYMGGRGATKWINTFAGYRFQSKKGLMIRLLYSPFIKLNTACDNCVVTKRSNEVISILGLSIGRRF